MIPDAISVLVPLAVDHSTVLDIDSCSTCIIIHFLFKFSVGNVFILMAFAIELQLAEVRILVFRSLCLIIHVITIV